MGDFLVAFFVVLASSLPSVRLIVAVNDRPAMIYNAALNQRVSVSPPNASCVSDREFLTLYNNDAVTCPNGCERNVSSHGTADARFPEEVVKMGGIHCHLQGEIRHTESQFVEDPIIGQPNMCWLTLTSWYGRSSLRQSFTYSAWFKPTDTQPRQ